jgi:tetratricopeptide (TPR) repeat protein
MLGRALLCLRERDAALAEAERADELLLRATAPPGRAFYVAGDAYTEIAQVLVAAGRPDRGAERASELLTAARAGGWRNRIGPAALVLGTIAEARGDHGDAARSYREALDAAGDDFPGVAWRAHVALASLCTLQGDMEESHRHASTARAVIDRLADELEGSAGAAFRASALETLTAAP